MQYTCHCKVARSKYLDLFDKWYQQKVPFLEMERRANEIDKETHWHHNDFRRHYQQHIVPEKADIKEFSKYQISEYIRKGMERCEKMIRKLERSDRPSDIRSLSDLVEAQRKLAELYLQYEKELKSEEKITFENVANSLALGLEKAAVPPDVIRKAIKALEKDFGEI